MLEEYTGAIPDVTAQYDLSLQPHLCFIPSDCTLQET